jgi:hypothetical protein
VRRRVDSWIIRHPFGGASKGPRFRSWRRCTMRGVDRRARYRPFRSCRSISLRQSAQALADIRPTLAKKIEPREVAPRHRPCEYHADTAKQMSTVVPKCSIRFDGSPSPIPIISDHRTADA